MFSKVKSFFKGLAGTVALGGSMAVFDFATGIVLIAICAVPVVLLALWAAGKYARTSALSDIRLARAKTLAKEELENEGTPRERQTKNKVEARALRILKRQEDEKLAKKEEKVAAKEHKAAMREAEEQATEASA